MQNDQYWMQQALKLAEQAESQGEVPIGAILIDAEQNILAQAYNHPIGLCDPTAHAEVLALRAAALKQNNYRLPGTTLYCTLEPCAMCAGAIIQARVERIVFAAHDPRSGALVSVLQLLNHPGLNHRAEVIGGILENESVKLLQNFFKQRR